MIEKILKDWKKRVGNNLNYKNTDHLFELGSMLTEQGWDSETIGILIENLKEIDIVRKKQPDGSLGGAYTVVKHNPDKGQQLVKKDASKDDLKKVDKGEPIDTDKKSDEKESDHKHSLQTDKERNKKLEEVAELFIDDEAEKVRGAGRFTMSQKDVKQYQAWLKLTPEQQQKKIDDIKKKQIKKLGGEVTETDIDKTLEILEKKLGKKKFNALKQALKKKGDPPPENSKGEKGEKRLRSLVKFYLETGGVSPITGEEVPFFDSQLDHVTSLDNGGTDTADNWMWLEARINQFKGKLTDKEVEAKLIRRGYMTAEELTAETDAKTLNNWEKAAERAYWETKFSNKDFAGLTQEKLDNMSAEDLDNLVEGFNRSLGATKAERERHPDFIPRYGTRKVFVSGSDKPLPQARSGAVKPDKNNPDSWGLVKGEDGKLSEPKYKDDSDGYEKAMADYDKARQSGGTKISSSEVRENIKNILGRDDNPLGAAIPDEDDTDGIDEAFEAIQAEKIAKKADIEKLQKQIKDNPKSASTFEKKLNSDVNKKFGQEKKDTKAKFGEKSKEYQILRDKIADYKLSKWKEWESNL